MSYQVYSSQELIELRIKLKVTASTADRLFGLRSGTYEECEKGFRILTINEDNLIKETNCFDDKGRNILPKWMFLP